MKENGDFLVCSIVRGTFNLVLIKISSEGEKKEKTWVHLEKRLVV